jgi:hypothetical protein
MGQYHRPVCIEAEEGLSPHSLGCGLKEGEQGFTRPGTPNAMVALVCARGGNMPADCSQSPLVGRWEIEVEAETPLEAAEKARHYQTKPGTTATVFEVAEIRPYAIRRYGDPVMVDLTPDRG